MNRLTASVLLGLLLCAVPAAAESSQVENLFDELMLSQGSEYLSLRKKLLETDGAMDYLRRVSEEDHNWKRKILANACIAWSQNSDGLIRLMGDKDVFWAFSRIRGTDYMGPISAAVNVLLAHAVELDVDDAVEALVMERAFFLYQMNAWNAEIERVLQGIPAGDPGRLANDVKEFLESEAVLWQWVSIGCMGTIGTSRQVVPLASIALRGDNDGSRIVATQILARLRNRDRRIPSRPGPNDGIPRDRTNERPVPAWQKEDVILTPHHVQTMWQALLLAMTTDSSDKVRKTAASCFNNIAFIPAIPFLKTAIAEMPAGDVRDAMIEALVDLEVARDWVP